MHLSGMGAAMTASNTAPPVLVADAKTADGVVIMDSGQDDSAGQVEIVVHRLYTQLWNGGREEVAAELFHPEFAYDGRTDLQGPQAKLAAIRVYRAAFPDLRFTVRDLIVDGNRAAVRTEVTFTDRSGLAGRPATGRIIRTWAVEHLSFRDGLIITDWVGVDWLGVFVQAGVVPDPWPH